MSVALGLALSFAIGLLANAVSVWIANERAYRRTGAALLMGEYKLYWYNTRRIRDRKHQQISRASVVIDRDWLRRARVRSKEDQVDPNNFEGYTYEGRLYATDTQVHWIRSGVKHAETNYGVFEKALSRDIACLSGILLLTANDASRKPMAIHCV